MIHMHHTSDADLREIANHVAESRVYILACRVHYLRSYPTQTN